MPRVSKDWSYEKSKTRYVANINKEKIVLLKGPRTRANDRIADEKYANTKALMFVQVTGDRTPIEVSLGAWLNWLATRSGPVAPNTLNRYQEIVWSFTELHGKVCTFRQLTDQNGISQ